MSAAKSSSLLHSEELPAIIRITLVIKHFLHNINSLLTLHIYISIFDS
jgi:hypothetical protein